MARTAGARCEAAYRSFSGADVAEAEVYRHERNVYVAVAEGTPIEEAIAAEDRRWRAYAEGQARKVADAPKIKRGPSAGHSTIGHRWVSADLFAGKANHIRHMVGAALA